MTSPWAFKRTARVTRVNCGIGLDEVNPLIRDTAQAQIHGTDNANRYRVVKPRGLPIAIALSWHRVFELPSFTVGNLVALIL